MKYIDVLGCYHNTNWIVYFLKVIAISFLNFQLESESLCDFDYLEITDGPDGEVKVLYKRLLDCLCCTEYWSISKHFLTASKTYTAFVTSNILEQCGIV